MRGVEIARKKTKSYPESFRQEAVKLADQPDRTAADVARELGILARSTTGAPSSTNSPKASLPWPMARTTRRPRRLRFDV
ncbi:MAG TPA: hypothetical protein ENI62_01755 [Gammaproteobacteria bacterium]|nr:hypothetical protein [Gammaproteobacteria bacterium]